MEQITEKWLKDKNACSSGLNWFNEQRGENPLNYSITGDLLVKLLIKKDKLQWANWLIVRIMAYKQYVSYAVYSAEQVIGIYEKKYPKDKRPRLAIEAAKKCIENPSEENKRAAYAYAAAADADAYAAAYAAAAAAAYAAAYAAAAAYYAAAAAYAAYAAYYAAYAAAAAYATYDAACAARKQNQLQTANICREILTEVVLSAWKKQR